MPSKAFDNLSKKDIELSVEVIFNSMVDALVREERIELRGLGAFSVKVREAHTGRNPKTGEDVNVPKKRTPFFTPGKELRKRVDSKKGFSGLKV